MNPELLEEIYRAAAIVARRWPNVIESDDAAQEIWVRVLDRSYIEKLAEMDTRKRMNTLVRIGNQVASGYRTDAETFSGQVYYGSDEVRALLRGGLYAKSRHELVAGSETLSEFLDLHEAAVLLTEHSPQHARVLGDVFLLGLTPPHHQTLNRAIDALTREMNRVHKLRGQHEGPGARRVLTNATASAVTSH